jgi:flavin reductase (DIM6/NTAB) family NADH-FMN oxidoreductase RutF
VTFAQALSCTPNINKLQFAGLSNKQNLAARSGYPARCALRHIGFMHKTIEPTILYFGTPVALISTLNEEGTPNIAPMSSAWWLGWSCMLGLGSMGKTSENLIRTGECVINLPSQDQVGHVDRLALTTGKNPVPEKKQSWGYRYEPDKLGTGGLTPIPSLDVRPPRIAECPVQMEGRVQEWRPFGKNVSANAFEVHISRLHLEESLLEDAGARPHIDAAKWRPLIMSFCRFFGVGEEVHPSRLAESSFMTFVRTGSAPQPAISR